MKNYKCDQCVKYNYKRKIKSPSDLKEVILFIKSLLKDGLIIEDTKTTIKNSSGVFEFNLVKENGPWDDYIEYYFTCTKCTQQFVIHAETYHGSGGSWEPVKP